jgi:hypothetical protein
MADTRKRAGKPKVRYWTLDRLLAALRLFYAEFGEAPLNTHAYTARYSRRGRGNVALYPSGSAILAHYPTLREAWLAAGVTPDPDRWHWSPIDDWYLREAAGILPLEVVAADLGRSRASCATRLQRLALEVASLHGWHIRRVCEGLDAANWERLHHRLSRLIRHGRLAAVRGTKAAWPDLAELPYVPGLDWSRASSELVEAVTRALRSRIVATLERRLQCSHPTS